MRKEQPDIEPRDKIEKENTRDERVFGADDVENEQADAGHRLAQTEPVLPEQFVLEQIIFRTAARERLEPDAEDDQPAVNAVAAQGEIEIRAGRIEGDHDPDANPEKQRDQRSEEHTSEL